MFGSSSRRQHTSRKKESRGLFGTRSQTGTRRHGGRHGLFHRTDPDRRAGGYKAALHNPNTTRAGRKHAKQELRMMGRGDEAHGHPSLKSYLKYIFGLRSRKNRSRYRTVPNKPRRIRN